MFALITTAQVALAMLTVKRPLFLFDFIKQKIRRIVGKLKINENPFSVSEVLTCGQPGRGTYRRTDRHDKANRLIL